MFKSMTGYGRGESKNKVCGDFFVEIQSVNRKFCDINVNLPKHLLSLESNIRAVIQKHIERGKLNVYIGQPRACEGHKLYLNKALVKEYYNLLKTLKKDLKLKGEIDIGLMAGFKELIIHSELVVDAEKIWPIIEHALKEALKDFQSMREKEGANIHKQTEAQLKEIENRLGHIEEALPELVKHYEERLQKRIKDAGLSVSNTDERIQKEVAIIAEHVDITEELNRMKSHFSQFRALMKKDTPVGRTLDFLLQEMMREANTMGSKAMHMDISGHVVFIKSELEKIREQIQNIE